MKGMVDKILQKFGVISVGGIAVIEECCGFLTEKVNKEIARQSKLGYRLQHFEIKNMKTKMPRVCAFLLFEKKENNNED